MLRFLFGFIVRVFVIVLVVVCCLDILVFGLVVLVLAGGMGFFL